ncbi:MAG TPA: MMPL family transporter [Anaeromyxobacteraceae bacterium]|nr:MMPL family transporter [Anaeromyxobacteraceae bacterium]
MVQHPLLERIFRRIVALRFPIIALYAALLPVALALALRIPSEGAIDKLVVPSDPDYVATRAFQKVFPEGQIVMVLLEADDPWRPEVLAALAGVEDRLKAVPGVVPISALDVYRRARPGFAPSPGSAADYRRFVTGTPLFQRQGLVGDRFQGIAVGFAAAGAKDRTAKLAAIDAALEGAASGPITQVRKVGAPYVEAWIEHESGAASVRYFPLFGLFVVVVTLFLYRSARTLVAILAALGTSVALAVGVGALLGFSFTVVSALVPLTVLVTTLATLVYLQSRFVDQPPDRDLEAHRVFALANKFLPVTASTVAAVLGFGALQVSRIRPVREMGLWTACGIAVGWAVAFSLFPALQKVLRTPTSQVVRTRIGVYDRLAEFLPGFTYRHRHLLVVGSLVLSAAGAVALFGIPGHLAHMKVGVDSLDYVDPGLAIHRDMLFFRKNVSGLNVARVWVRTPPGAVIEPEVLRGLDRFSTALERLPGVSSVVGPTTFLRMRRYLAGQGDELPQDPAAFARIAADVEQLLLTEGELRGFVDVGTLGNAQLTVVFSGFEAQDYGKLSEAIRRAWDATVARDPAFRGAEMQVVGESMLQAKVGSSLVPTLTESFALTAALIFVAFLFVFRSASARLMAMIPSVFAILMTFLGMRVFGASLNVATILIATTVLGTTENDQIHFFYHLQEGRAENRGFEAALRYALRVSGRAIVFATLINAVGFLALSVSNFPPLRQFGIITAAAFLLGMTADFTALPAALWIVSGERPAGAGSAPGT